MIESNGFGFEQYFSGLTLGLHDAVWTALLLGGLFLALVAGDVVSKEVEEGTMRMMLCRPVSRWRIGLLKYHRVRGLHLCDACFYRLVGAGGRDWLYQRTGAGCLRSRRSSTFSRCTSRGRAVDVISARLPLLAWCLTSSPAWVSCSRA